MSDNIKSVWKDIVTVAGFLTSFCVALGCSAVLGYRLGIVNEDMCKKCDWMGWTRGPK